jgi:hypothetical protein
MIERTYRCNLCRHVHGVNSRNLFGLLWSEKSLFVQQSIWEFESHICRACYTAIRIGDLPMGIEQPEAAE